MSFQGIGANAGLKFGELYLQSCLSSFHINIPQFPVFLPESSGSNLCHTTINSFKESIMDEHVLGLKTAFPSISNYNFNVDTHTSVCTMKHLFLLIPLTNPKISTVPSCLICCSWQKRVMKVPVLPTPALQCTTIGPALSGLVAMTLRTNPKRGEGYSGTP